MDRTGPNQTEFRIWCRTRVTNTTLRERFKLHDKHRNQVTNLIGDAVDAGRIKRKDAGSGKKFAEYIPYWA